MLGGVAGRLRMGGAVAFFGSWHPTQPWCSQVEGGVVGTDCTDLEGLLNDYFGERISQQVTSLLGEDAGALAEVVQSTLSGESTEGLSGILESDAVSGLFSDDSGVLADTLGGVLEGKSPEEIANLVSATGAGGLLEGKSAEEIASLVSSGDLPEIPQETIDALIQGSAAAEAAPQTETQ